MAPHSHEKAKFDSLARGLVKKGVLTDHGKSTKVQPLAPYGNLLVRKHLEVHGR